MLDSQRIYSNSDAVWFAGSFLTGFVLLLLLRWPSLLDQSALLAALVLCAIICFYAFAVWHWGRFRLRRDDRAADNLYYLGFIFTVCALGISLYRFSVTDEGRIADIVGDLGVGISTTVFGLFLRVLFLQREDPADVEDRVQRELMDVAETTLDRIRQTGAIVDQGQVLTRQTIDELNQTMKQCSSQLTKRMQELDHRISEVQIPPDMITARLDPVLENSARSITGFAKRLDSIDAPSDLVSRRLDHALAGMKESAPVLLRETALELQKASNEALANARTQLDGAIKHIEQILVSRATEIELPTREIDLRTRNTLDRFDESAEHFIKGMQRMGESLAQSERALAESPRALEQSFESLRARFASVFDQLEQRVSNLGQGLDAIDTSRIGDALTATDSLVQESRKTVAEQRAAIAEQTAHLSELTNQLQSINASLPQLLSDLQELARQPVEAPIRTDGNSETASRRSSWWPFNP